MELSKLLYNKNFEEIKNIVSKEPYYLQVKEDPSNKDLYMLVYNNDKSDFSNPVVNECRGIILEKNTNKIVCYTFNKKTNFEWDHNDNIYNSIDGTQIKVYYYNNQWNYSTTRCINADNAYWYSDKSFLKLFNECLENYNFDFNKLNIEYCYSFVICHKENRIVTKYNENKLYHVLTRNLQNMKIIEDEIGIPKPNKINLNSKDELEKLLHIEDSKNEGIFIWKDGKHNKIKFNSYLRIKNMRTNTKDPLYEYLKNVCENRKDEYIKEFSEYEDNFKNYEKKISMIINKLHYNYMESYVHKNKLIKQVNKLYHKHIRELHNIYKNENKKITKDMVRNYVLNLDAKQIMHILNTLEKNKKKYHQ